MTHTNTTDEALERDIVAKGLTAQRIRKDHIDAMAKRIEYTFSYAHTSTFCHAFLDGHFLLATGHSACISPENYDKDIGDRIALADAEPKAIKELWKLEGYALYTSLKGAA